MSTGVSGSFGRSQDKESPAAAQPRAVAPHAVDHATSASGWLPARRLRARQALPRRMRKGNTYWRSVATTAAGRDRHFPSLRSRQEPARRRRLQERPGTSPSKKGTVPFRMPCPLSDALSTRSRRPVPVAPAPRYASRAATLSRPDPRTRWRRATARITDESLHFRARRGGTGNCDPSAPTRRAGLLAASSRSARRSASNGACTFSSLSK